MNSIREYLIHRILGGVCLVMLAAGGLFCLLVHALIVEAFDETLEARAETLVSLTSREDRIIEIDFDVDYLSEYENPLAIDPDEVAAPPDPDDAEDDEDRSYFQMFLVDGRVMRRSPSLGEADLPLAGVGEDAVFMNVRLPDGGRGRLVQVDFLPQVDLEPEEEDDADADEDPLNLFPIPADVDPETARVVVVVARSRGHLDVLLGMLYGSYAVITLLVLGGIWMVVHGAVRRGLAPFREMDVQVRGIGPETLDARLHLEAPPGEFDTILSTFNSLLERVEAGFLRERRFSSNVAHELRTPVAELRNACEVGARWPDDPEAVRGFFEDTEDIARQMERIVSNLLALTRCDNGTETVEPSVFLLEPLVRECWGHVATQAEAKGVRFDYRIDPALSVETDPGKLAMIVQNLMDNAVAYAVPNTTIVCRGRPGRDGVDLSVENNTDNLRSIDLEHVFDRFWRKDHARRDGNRSGLGLSIVKAFADLLGIPLRVQVRGGNVFEISMRLPA